ncbi:MAG TPA: hypothetical protein VK988_18765 [Acidimicrobiales bacterium]|nr:hypothetical protein [Acidimicrobiales bacterium]
MLGSQPNSDARSPLPGVNDHPLMLANTKAKRLGSLLARQGAFRNDQPPGEKVSGWRCE